MRAPMGVLTGAPLALAANQEEEVMHGDMGGPASPTGACLPESNDPVPDCGVAVEVWGEWAQDEEEQQYPCKPAAPGAMAGGVYGGLTGV